MAFGTPTRNYKVMIFQPSRRSPCNGRLRAAWDGPRWKIFAPGTDILRNAFSSIRGMGARDGLNRTAPGAVRSVAKRLTWPRNAARPRLLAGG